MTGRQLGQLIAQPHQHLLALLGLLQLTLSGHQTQLQSLSLCQEMRQQICPLRRTLT